MLQWVFTVLTVGMVFLHHSADGRLTCLNNAQNPVDWFINYKFPEHHKFMDWVFPQHLYMDAMTSEFVTQSTSLNSTEDNAIFYTLSVAYNNHKSADLGYVFYNDEKPVECGSKEVPRSRGHTKGVVLFDGESGVWIVHSVPKYPPPTNSSYNYPHSGIEYGQHIFCITLNSVADVNKVGQQLLFYYPFVYDSNLPSGLQETYAVFADVIAGKREKERKFSIYTLAGTGSWSYLSFAKNIEFHKDLYSELVNSNLKCNMAVQSWLYPKNDTVHSTCNTTYKVWNVETVDTTPSTSFSTKVDHSKYTLCYNKGAPYSSLQQGDFWVCIGDINRETSQFKRGGGTVCFHSQSVHSQYYKMIENVEHCP